MEFEDSDDRSGEKMWSFSLHLLVNLAMMITSVFLVQVESFYFERKQKSPTKKNNQSLEICSGFRSALSTEVTLRFRCGGKKINTHVNIYSNILARAMSIDMT